MDNYVVDLQFKETVIIGVNSIGYGRFYYEGGWYGASYYDLTTTSITVIRATNDWYAPEVRVRIWVYN